MTTLEVFEKEKEKYYQKITFQDQSRLKQLNKFRAEREKIYLKTPEVKRLAAEHSIKVQEPVTKPLEKTKSSSSCGQGI